MPSDYQVYQWLIGCYCRRSVEPPYNTIQESTLLRMFGGLRILPINHLLCLPRRPTRTGRQRRIILSTPIAESSITIDGVTAVVDSGLRRSPMFDPATCISRLVTHRISQDAAEQRTGRAGRTQPGTGLGCVHICVVARFDFKGAMIHSINYCILNHHQLSSYTCWVYNLTFPGFPGRAGLRSQHARSSVAATQYLLQCDLISCSYTGVCYRLWSPDDHDQLLPSTPPEIVSADLAPLALTLANWGCLADHTSSSSSSNSGGGGVLPWLDQPDPVGMREAADLLLDLAAVDDKCKITDTGGGISLLVIY